MNREQVPRDDRERKRHVLADVVGANQRKED